MASISSVDGIIFGPLDSRHCLLFYTFSIIGFVLFCLVLLSTITIGLFMKQKKNRTISLLEISFSIYVLMMLFMVYFENRILYSMCIKSTADKITPK